MSTEGSVREKLLQKYGINGSGNSSGTTQTSGQSVREQLLSKYSQENVQSRQNAVADWAKRFDSAVQGFSDYRKNLGEKYTTDSSGGYRAEMESLIKDYDSISEYAGRMGLPNAQRYLKSLQDILQNVSEFDSYMAQFADEEDYTRKMTEQKAAQREYDWMNADEEDYKLYGSTRSAAERFRYFDKDTAEAGWNAYQADKSSPGAEKSWAQKVTEYLGGIPADTSQIAMQFDIAKRQYAADTSWQEPDDRWSDWMKENFGYLYATDPEAAKEFAAEINDALNRRERTGQEEAILAGATGSIPGAAMHTAGALLGAPFGIADYLDTVAEYAGRGRISEKAYMTPASYAQTVTGGVAEHLNEQHGTLDERIPVIGGKGWGDAYGLVTSILQSSLAGHTGGKLGTLVQFFGSAAASGVQEAKNRGASDEQALLLGTLQGLAEGLAEQAGIDNLMKVGASHTWKEFAVNLLKQGGAEGLEEGLTTLMNNISDQIVMQGDSVFYTLVDNYIADGMDPEEAKKQAWLDMANDIAFDMLGGFLSGAVHAGPQTAAETYRTGREMRTTYGEYQQELVEEGMESAEGSDTRKVAERLQDKLNAGRDLSGSDLYRIVDANTQTAAAERLTELGETGDVQVLSRAIAARTVGRELTGKERRMIARSLNAQTVLREFETGRVAEQTAEAPMEAQKPEKEVPVQTVVREEQPVQEAKAEPVEEPAATVLENRTVSKPETAPASGQQVTGKLTAEDSTEVQAEQTIEQASRSYGAQAGAMLHTYHQGQDVAKYDQAYRAAFDMGRSGVSLNYVKNSPMTAYLTDGQKELAHKAGAAAARMEAQSRDEANKTGKSGSTERRKGTVKGEGVTIEDLRKGFNDQQGRAYRYLASVAEATGVDIVLYKSEASEADGRYQGAQGRFVWDENKIYIDVNAGLSYARDAGEAAKYAMLRTFGHEFTHFIEKWNPVQYNDFRETVFKTLEERGENVNDLIEEKMALDESGKMTYEEASREVVAEAMTDILPDSNFAQELVQRNKTVFQKLLEKLKEFTENLRNYFQSLGSNRSREANALKEQVGDTVKYLDSIVKLFDEAAAGAVESYQQSAEKADGNTTEVQSQSRERLSPETDEFRQEIDNWDKNGRPEGESFILGSTGSVLQGLGAIESDIYIQGDKINTIFKDHPEMGLKEIKNIPEILENPVLVLASRNVNRAGKSNTRLTIFGMVKAQNGLPVMIAFDLHPQENNLYLSDMQKVVSAYTKDRTPSATMNLIQNSDVLFAEKEKTAALLRSAGFQMPANLLRNGYIGSISYSGTDVNIQGVPFSSVFSNGKKQRQQRTDTMTDREVLKAASTKLREGNLSKAEQDALDIFDRRMSRLEALQQERENQDRLYREQKSGENPNGTEAAKTRNRMKLLDEQIRRARNEVLEVDNKTILRKLLQKGKQIVEQQERARSQRVLENYRKNRAESRDKTAMRHKVQNVVKELNDLLLNESKKRHIPDNMKKAVAQALDLVNMDTLGAEERIARYRELIAKETDQDKIDAYTATMENIMRQGEKLGQRLRELRDAYEEIENSTDPDIANFYDPVIAGSLRELSQSIGNTALKDMSIEQLSDVYDMYRMVLTRVRDANKAFLRGKSESIAELATKSIDEVKLYGGEHKSRIAMLDPVKKFFWNNMKPVYAMEWIGSKTLTDVFNSVRAGEDTWAKDVTEARAYYLEKSRKFGYDKWDFDKKYRFESTSGITFDLTLEQILSLYAYSRRDQAIDHLRLGGFVFDSNIETYEEKGKGGKILRHKVNTADAHQLSAEILGDIIGTLTAEQRGFVEEMQDYLSATMGAKGNEVTMKMYGVKLFKEKHYFPLKSAKQFLFEQNEASGEVKLKNSGFTNKTVAKANNPVILQNFMDVWSGHVNDMSMYHSFVLPLEDFNRVLNYNSPKKEGVESVSVKGTIQSAYGPAAVSYLKQMITDLNGGARSDPTAGIINKFTGLFKKGAVFASMSVVVQQPSAIARAAALVDTQYFFGPKVDSKKHKQLWDEIKRYAPVAIIKEMGYFDTNMGQSTQDYIKGKEYADIREKVKALFTDSNYRDEALSKLPALADEMAWCNIWEAVKRETKAKNPDMKATGEEFLKKVGERFTEVIVKTQVYDSVLSRSAFMRSKDTGMKAATAFMAEPTTSINMIADALVKGKRGDRRYARTAIGAVLASQILNSILVSVVYAARDDDDDQTYAEKYVEALAGELRDSFNPAGYIPFIKDIQSIAKGYTVERSDMAVISDLWEAWQSLGSDKLSGYKKVEKFAGSIAQMFGLPLKNIMRDIRAVWQVIEGAFDEEKTTSAGLLYAIRQGWTGETVSNQKQLYDAMIRDDREQTERVSGRYKDESAVSSAIRKGLREYDSRIWEAAKLWNEGDLEGYMKIAKEIVGEKHFTQDDVVLAIRAEAAAMEEKKTSSNSDRAYGYYTAEKFGVAVSQGNDEMAKIIRQDLIDTAMKNGKSERDAESSFNTSARSAMKELWLEGKLTDEAAVKAMADYCGDTREEAEKKVAEWSFARDNGFGYDEKAQQFKDGKITGEELRDMLMETGGKSAEEAAASIVSYSRDAYEEGYFSREDTAKMMTKYGGLTEAEAEGKLRYIDFKLENPGVPVDDAWVDEYYNEVESSGISIEVFVDYRNKVKGITGSGKKEGRMAVIDSLPISDAQKDALYYAEGWAESKLWQAPWRK